MTDFDRITNGITQVATLFNVKFRLSLRDGIKTEWSTWIGFPEKSYIEISGTGPMLLSDVITVEIDPVEKKYISRLNKSKIVDHSVGVKEVFNKMNIVHNTINEIILCHF